MSKYLIENLFGIEGWSVRGMLLCVGFCGTVHFHTKQQNAKELSANSTLLHPLKIAVIKKAQHHAIKVVLGFFIVMFRCFF